MNELAEIEQRVTEILAALPLAEGRLREVVHIPGVFQRWTERTPSGQLARAIKARHPTRGNGPVWYIDDENHNSGAPHNQFARTLPLPNWACKVQHMLLSQLWHANAWGWSSVVFYCESTGASVGEHVDNEDVYTVQLSGTKLWWIDPPDLSWLTENVVLGRLARWNASESWVRNGGDPIPFRNPRTIRLAPGDMLAMPAFCLHKVQAEGEGHNISFNASICQEQDWLVRGIDV